MGGAPINCPACPPKLSLLLRLFQDGGFFFIGGQQRTRRKVDQFGAMSFFFFFGAQQKTQRKVDNPKILAPPPERNFAPLKTVF